MADTVLVVDGGQSSTLALIATVNGEVLSYGLGGPVNHVAAKYGRQRMTDALTAAVGDARQRAAVDKVDLAYLGLTGGVKLATELLPEILPAGRVIAESDAVAVLASGTRGEPGVGVIAGTGVVAVGLAAGGERVFRGGWGYLAGDAGGGYWTGMEAIRAAALAEDEIIDRGPLHDKVLEHFEVASVRELVAELYAERIGRPDCARLAPAVLELFRQGDPCAEDIVSRGVEALAELAVTTARVTALPQEHRNVVLGGGLMRPSGVVAGALIGRLSRLLPDWHVYAASRPPVIGGLYLALRAIGRPADDRLVARFDASLERFPQIRTKAREELTA